MKKVFFLSVIVVLMAFTAEAQLNIKGISVNAFSAKAAAALKAAKANKGAQQGMKQVVAGEECGMFTVTETNKEGVKYQAAKEFLIISDDGTNGFAFTIWNTIYKDNKYIVFRGLALNTGTCVDASSKITITFTDETSATLNNLEDANCKGVVQFYFGPLLNNTDVLEALKTKTVKSIKLAGVEKTIAKGFSEANQLQLQNVLKCL